MPTMQTVHELKTWPEYFEAVWFGDKNFEVRKNDRSFKVGDLLLLKEFDPSANEYTGRELKREVSYILADPEFVKEGYVVMGM